jgi:hypothetical protein
MRIKYACVSLCLLLGGCFGGPSSDDVKSAMQEVSTALLGSRMAPTFEDISNLSCKEANGKPGYLCSFNATSYSPMTKSRSAQYVEARFVQNNSKWVAMNDK